MTLTFNRSLSSIVGKELHSDLTEIRNSIPKTLPWEAASAERFEKLSRIARTAQLRTVHRVLAAIAESSKVLTGSSGNDGLLDATNKLMQSLIAHLNEMVQDHKNTPLKMAKPLHAIQTQLGHSPSPVLSAELFMPFTPEDVSGDRPSALPPSEFATAIRDYRAAYQNGVIKLLKEHDVSQYAVLRQALVSIEPKNPHVGFRVFFEASIAVLDILIKNNEKDLDNLSKWILSKIDPELNQIAKGATTVNDDLLSCMLHFIARADADVSVRVRKLQDHLNLKAYLADLNGVAPELVEKFTQVLVRSREVWSQHASTDPSRVAKLIAELQTKSAMLKNQGFTVVINALHDVITAIAEGKAQVNGEQLSLEGAGSLLILEQQLRDGSNINSANLSANRLYQLIGRNTGHVVSASEPQTATATLHVLAGQIQEDLGQLEPRLLELLNNQLDGEQELRSGLKKLSKILDIFGRGNPLAKSFAFFEQHLITPDTSDAKAEVATRYTQLGTLIESLKTSDKNAMSAAQKWLDSQSKVEAPAEGEEFKDVPHDSEMLEIFLEEASGIVVDIEKWLSQLRSDPSMHDTVVNMRRGYHTLKGSGRMVGLMRFGDLAYMGELLLNNWISSKKIPSPELLDYLRRSLDVITGHVASFKSKGYSFVDFGTFEEEAVALGGTALTEAPQSRRKSVKLSTSAPAPAPAPAPQPELMPVADLPEFNIPSDIQSDLELPLSLDNAQEPEVTFDVLETTTSGAPLIPSLPDLNTLSEDNGTGELKFAPEEKPLSFALPDPIPAPTPTPTPLTFEEPVVMETVDLSFNDVAAPAPAPAMPELKFTSDVPRAKPVAPAPAPVKEPAAPAPAPQVTPTKPVARKAPDAWQQAKQGNKPAATKPAPAATPAPSKAAAPAPKKAAAPVKPPEPEKKGFMAWLLGLFGIGKK